MGVEPFWLFLLFTRHECYFLTFQYCPQHCPQHCPQSPLPFIFTRTYWEVLQWEGKEGTALLLYCASFTQLYRTGLTCNNIRHVLKVGLRSIYGFKTGLHSHELGRWMDYSPPTPKYRPSTHANTAAYFQFPSRVFLVVYYISVPTPSTICFPMPHIFIRGGDCMMEDKLKDIADYWRGTGVLENSR